MAVPKDLMDRKIRKNLGNHYSVDTNVIFYSFSKYNKPTTVVKRDDIKDWLRHQLITIYEPIYRELLYKMGRLSVRARDLISRPNIRILIGTKAWQKIINELNPQLYSDLLKELPLDSADITLLCMSKYENATIISFDRRVNEIAYKYDISCYNSWEKLPTDFKGIWRERI